MYSSLLTGRINVTAKCLVTAQAVQEKLDYHFMLFLEPGTFHFNSLKESFSTLGVYGAHMNFN